MLPVGILLRERLIIVAKMRKGQLRGPKQAPLLL